ncbi:hypothetical protein E8E13_000151 [Curvularia kusanoi]|uniref:Uncharacterized protein n=1 Tax=Curvularia kusanoi TaxID=90978 RepID=A0A9P4W7G8_CURKU|nr:hypothetical protein E8E13_000151 [Curvularia kusanoi]
MRVPIEIIAEIIDYVDLDGDLGDTLQLRLVSHLFNQETLKALLHSEEIPPRVVQHLLQMNGVDVQPQIIHHRLVQCRKVHAPSGIDGEEIRRTCFLGGRGPRAFSEWEMISSLPPNLIRPFLIRRMQRGLGDPCLLSVFMDRSIVLIAEHNDETNQQNRQELLQEKAASFDTELLDERFCENFLNSLFDQSGLDYWLPLYDAAHLTVYPRPEDNLRLFHIFRLSHIASQIRDLKGGEILHCPIGDLLAHHPTTPEYARLFAIDCFNVIINSNNDLLYNELLVSNTGKLLNTLSVPERIWCAAKQAKWKLCKDLIDRALGEFRWTFTEDAIRRPIAIEKIVRALVQAGEQTHSGRVSIQELLECEDIKQVQAWAESFNL